MEAQPGLVGLVMKRMLVVVDGSVQARLALDQALEIAQALPSSEVLLLNVPPPLSAWQVRRPLSHTGREASERVTAVALARAEAAGVRARSRIEVGETAEVAAKIARDEHCDHIFLPEHGPTPVARALMTLTGLRTNTAASRILSLSRLPVTVIAHERHGEA